MQFVSTTSNVKVEKRPPIAARQSLLSLYDEPPQEELTLDEFEMFSLERLQLLRSIELLKAKNGENDTFNREVYELEKRHLKLKDADAFRRDLVSHFILRLAYCQTEDLRRWFLTQECALLKSRLENLDEDERAGFLLRNNMEFEQVSAEDKSRCADQLTNLSGVTLANVAKTIYFKVPFQQALTLVASRSVYLERGFAYVPLQRLMSIIVTRFRMQLSRALVEASNSFDVVGADSRIGPLLKNMNKQFIGDDFTKKGRSIDNLTADKVELAAEINMPLCMKNLHSNLKREHKLKHWGRLQYGLFLKGAGLDLEGAQQFWESHFSKVMNHDQFVKNYGYSFRHMYGKEGARKNYTPYSCMKIIMGTPPEAGAHHGCPYRHLKDESLAAMLTSLKLSNADSSEIKSLAKSSQYQLACQRHFDVTHPGHTITESVANHPNLWFQSSIAYHRAKAGGAVEAHPNNDDDAAISGDVAGDF